MTQCVIHRDVRPFGIYIRKVYSVDPDKKGRENKSWGGEFSRGGGLAYIFGEFCLPFEPMQQSMWCKEGPHSTV